MRHTVLVKGSTKIQRGQLTYYFASFQDGDCVKLSQKDRHIYLIYRLTQSMGQKQVEVNEQILLQNGLTTDTNSTVQQFNPRITEHLKVEVSQLDWKIINMNQNKIAESFLEQISVVWPNAKVPIYYDQANYVVLNTLCEGVFRLNINTTVEFIEKNSDKKEGLEDMQEDQPYQQQLILRNQVSLVDMGYLNRIFISNSLKEKLKIQEDYWIIENQLEFEEGPTISELINLEKKQEKDKSTDLVSRKKLVLLQSKETKEQNDYECSRQSRRLLGLSQKLSISNKQSFKPKIQNLSLQIFLSDQNFAIKIHKIPKNLQSSPFPPKQQLQQQFSHHILNILFNKKQFYILQQEYPYYFQQSFYILTLTHKNDPKSKDKFYRLAFIGKETPQKRQQYLQKLMENKITFVTWEDSSLLFQKYQTISKWISIMQQHQNTKNELQNNQNQIKTQHIFQIIYHQELNKINKFINTTQFPQQICVISSYGSNGKTFLHQYLKKKSIRMWKVNFRELNSPSLSFKQIDFYLEWIFANTPYNTIFFDDFDSLCSKIDEGDQLRKREKTISKLFLRKMNKYIKTYACKLIITAKSDSNLDEELATHLTVTLKNPNRELRLKSLNAISQKKQIYYDYSPIKKVRLQQEQQQQGNQNEEQGNNKQKQLQEIVEATESLTFGTFVKHAVTFTKPKNIKTTQIYDFSKIAGLKNAKSTIKNIIQKPIKYSFLFKSVPIKLPRGILLYGGTGNGKSALGLSVQDEFKMKYFSVKGSDILSKYIGGSEAAVRDIFEKALSVSPSIIFFDQFQSIVPKRSSNNTGVNDRIVNQFLCYLDGVSAISGVYIIAASSRPDLIDPAVLRPGRLDAHLFLDYPEEEERRELVGLFRKSIQIGVEEGEIVEKTGNFSYSDLIGLFKELRIKRSAEVLKLEKYTSQDFVKISRQLFYQTLKNFKLSVDPQTQNFQRKTYLNFRDGVSPDIKTQKQIQH